MPRYPELEQWLMDTMTPGETRDSRFTRFGQSLDVSLHCVRHWIYGQRNIPDPQKVRIARVTDGAVTIEDMVRQ